MCGICGVVTLDAPGDPEEMQEQIARMLEAMAHRGPDSALIRTRPRAFIGANRLAIRGLSDDQPPLIEGDSGVVAVCNGEIDNHRELREWLASRGHVITRSTDVAVIPALYLETGTAFVEHLQGVFAIALWDPRQQRLILARDRVGERHLYYTQDEGITSFATELTALNVGQQELPQVDASAVAHYLKAGFCPAPQSALAGVHKVRPGEMLLIDGNGAERHRYWRNPLGQVAKTKPDVKAFDAVFRRAVTRQSDIDVDYGVLLSGGVDSALVAAVACSVRPDKRPTAYTIRFPESSFDEGSQAADVADMLGCRCVPVTVTAEDLPGTLQDLINTTGEPLADPAWLPLSLIARRASQDVRFVLAGEGADELFGGYPTYLGARFAGYYASLPLPVRSAFRRFVNRLPVSDKKVTVSFLLKRFVQGQELDSLARHLLWTASIQPQLLQRLGLGAPSIPQGYEGLRGLDQVQLYDFENPLPEALMAKADRGGMRHALELRAPFLDQAVIEFAATLPVSQRVHGLTTKAFLKRYALEYLPRSVVHRRKRGLSVPLASWLRDPLYDWARSRLASPRMADAGVDSTAALELLSEHRARTSDHARALWTLIVLSEWLEWAAQRQPLQATPEQPQAVQL